MKRPRVLLGIELIIGALFLLHAHDCGVVGGWAERGLAFLLGRYGTTLVAIGLVAAGVAVAVPRKTWTLVRAGAGALGAVVQRVRRRTSGSAARDDAPPTSKPPLRPALLAEVRRCLRRLGYTASETDAVLPRLDSGAGLDGMIRQALTLLRKAA